MVAMNTGQLKKRHTQYIMNTISALLISINNRTLIVRVQASNKHSSCMCTLYLTHVCSAYITATLFIHHIHFYARPLHAPLKYRLKIITHTANVHTLRALIITNEDQRQQRLREGGEGIIDSCDLKNIDYNFLWEGLGIANEGQLSRR